MLPLFAFIFGGWPIFTARFFAKVSRFAAAAGPLGKIADPMTLSAILVYILQRILGFSGFGILDPIVGRPFPVPGSLQRPHIKVYERAADARLYWYLCCLVANVLWRSYSSRILVCVPLALGYGISEVYVVGSDVDQVAKVNADGFTT